MKTNIFHIWYCTTAILTFLREKVKISSFQSWLLTLLIIKTKFGVWKVKIFVFLWKKFEILTFLSFLLYHVPNKPLYEVKLKQEVKLGKATKATLLATPVPYWLHFLPFENLEPGKGCIVQKGVNWCLHSLTIVLSFWAFVLAKIFLSNIIFEVIFHLTAFIGTFGVTGVKLLLLMNLPFPLNFYFCLNVRWIWIECYYLSEKHGILPNVTNTDECD